MLMVVFQNMFPWLGIEITGFPTTLSRIDVVRTRWRVYEERWLATQQVVVNKYRYEVEALGGKEYEIKRYVESQVTIVKKGTYKIDLRRYTDTQSFIVDFDNTLRL